MTLQRFNFEPQFVAGLNPSTSTSARRNPAGSSRPTDVPVPDRWRRPGVRASTLNIGTVAGFGKLFSYGTRLLTSFANTTTFNFVGSQSPAARPSGRSCPSASSSRSSGAAAGP